MNNYFRKDPCTLFLLSLSILSYEVLIIRTLSVLFKYDLLFMIISLSILGLGVGGIANYNLSKKFQPEKYFQLSLFLFPISFILSIYAITSYFETLKLAGSIFVVLLPFFLCGMLISFIFSKEAEKSPLLYFFDLLGGACGCLLSIPLMHFFGPLNSVLFVGITASFIVVFNGERMRWLPLVITVVVFTFNMKYASINLEYQKLKKVDSPLGQILDYPAINAEWLSSSWDIYSRCDLVKTNNDDMKRSIFINGGTQAMMMRFDENPKTQQFIKDFVSTSIMFFPYLTGSNSEVLNVGSGGGLDVLMASLAGADKITAVEINKGVIDMVNRNKEFTGDIYGRENVELVHEDGRTFIMRSKKKYDRIVLSLASTFAFSDINSMAQMENYLYTKEAFSGFFSHLKENGTLLIYIDYPELLEKFIFTAIEVLQDQFNISSAQAMSYIASFETEYMSGYGYVIMLKRSPYTKNETDTLMDISQSYRLTSISVPFQKSENDFDKISDGTLSPMEYISNNTGNLEPSTDESPFFLEVVFNHRVKLFNLLVTVTLIMLVITLFFQNSIVRTISTEAEEKKRLSTSGVLSFIPYFISIGTGFMLVEILLTKRFSFYLGFPHLNIAVILFSILTGTGIGSLFSNRIPLKNIEKTTGVMAIILILVLFVFDSTQGLFIEKTIGFSIAMRAMLVALYLLPISILLGFFFPSGLRMAGCIAPKEVSWLWGINGIASVAGSILSVVVSMSFGFRYVLFSAMLFYFFVSLSLLKCNIFSKKVNL